jgi:hypothetical protein
LKYQNIGKVTRGREIYDRFGVLIKHIKRFNARKARFYE